MKYEIGNAVFSTKFHVHGTRVADSRLEQATCMCVIAGQFVDHHPLSQDLVDRWYLYAFSFCYVFECLEIRILPKLL